MYIPTYGRPRLDHYLEFLARKAIIASIIPLNRKAYFSKISELPEIKGPALVAGSAPEPTIPRGADNSWFRISVNASQAVFSAFGFGEPNLTIFQPKIKFEDEGRQAYWQVLKGRGTGHLIFSVNRRNDGRIEEFLKSKDFHAAKITYLSERFKNAIVREVAKQTLITPYRYERSVSNGLFSVFLALRLGANPVVMTGFSFSDGWFHSKEVAARRNHQWIDRYACQRFVELGLPVYTSEREFSAATGLPLWKGNPRSL